MILIKCHCMLLFFKKYFIDFLSN